MRRAIIIIFILFFSGFLAKAQVLDSIRASINRKGSFSFDFNSRNSFITNNDAHIFGYMMGVRFDRKIGIGGGFNSLNSNIYKTVIIDGTYTNELLHFYFFSYYLEYIFRVTKHWEIDVPVLWGLGGSYYSYSQTSGTVNVNSKFILPIEPSVEVDYDFNKYWGLYIQAGYRWMLVNNPQINEDFNSPTWSFGVLIFPFEIYAGLFPKTKLAHIIEDN